MVLVPMQSYRSSVWSFRRSFQKHKRASNVSWVIHKLNDVLLFSRQFPERQNEPELIHGREPGNEFGRVVSGHVFFECQKGRNF